MMAQGPDTAQFLRCAVQAGHEERAAFGAKARERAGQTEGADRSPLSHGLDHSHRNGGRAGFAFIERHTKACLAGGLEHLCESMHAGDNVGAAAPGGTQFGGLHDAHRLGLRQGSKPSFAGGRCVQNHVVARIVIKIGVVTHPERAPWALATQTSRSPSTTARRANSPVSAAKRSRTGWARSSKPLRT